MGQFSTLDQLKKILQPLRSQKKVVFTNGCFDLLHIGHVRYLQNAKSQGDILVVALNSDDSVKKLKGPSRPVQSETDRAEILAALACVDHTFIFTEETPERVIKELKPDVLVKGGDWEISKIVGAEFVQSYGGKVLSLNFVDGKSTTNIIQKAKVDN